MTPATVAGVCVWRRAAVPGDDAFLYALYASTRDDLSVLWPEEARRQLCELQWRAQRAGYAATHPAASDEVVEVDARPAGRILVDARSEDVVVVDVALLPEHRGRGIGRALLEEVQRDAARSGRGVRLSVRQGSPARSLYERLGFVATATQGLHTEMRWAP